MNIDNVKTNFLSTANRFFDEYISDVLICYGENASRFSDDTAKVNLFYRRDYNCLYICSHFMINNHEIKTDIEKFRIIGSFEFQSIKDKNEKSLFHSFVAVVLQKLENEVIVKYPTIFSWENTFTYCSVDGCIYNKIPTICNNNGQCIHHSLFSSDGINPDHLILLDSPISKDFNSSKQPPKPKKISKAQTERSKMSASLRYDILERDGFKCNYCGASPELDNDIQLHVDHIIPVSKGGKTEWDNLQVLCQRCNLGKSNKMPLAA